MTTNSCEKGRNAALLVGEKWVDLCKKEVENIQLRSREGITGLKALYVKLKYELSEINSWLNAGPGERPQQVVKYNLKIGLVFLFSGCLLWSGENFLVLWTFDPIPEMGVKKYFISAAITFLGFISFERVLEYLGKLIPARSLIILSLFVAVGAGIMALVALLDLALVRGFLLKALIGTRMMSSAEISGALDFYKRLGPLMIPLFAAMAVAFALGGALMMREASERIAASSSVLKLYRKKSRIQNLMTEIPSRIERLEALPRIFENEFSSGAIEAMERIRKRGESVEKHRDTRLLVGIGIFIVVLLLALIFAGRLFAGESVVVGLDMSLSENATDHTGETEFDKNRRAVGEQIIPKMGPGSDLWITGITGNSLARPYYILRARTGKEAGYFGELLKKDMAEIRGKWEKVSSHLKPTEKYTDILGFLSLAEMVFKSVESQKKALVLFSDMRHCTNTIDLERPDRIDPKMLEKLKDKIHIPDLEGVDVYIYGVHCFLKSDVYYHELKKFWVDFFSLTKGNLRAYSNLREVNLERERRLP